jgi:protoporphyrinogen oxidase
MQGKRIAVLGAGPMGLAVAYQLARDGHQPVVFEADDRVGGMTAMFDFAGLQIERYYHFHCILLSFLNIVFNSSLSLSELHKSVPHMNYAYLFSLSF